MNMPRMTLWLGILLLLLGVIGYLVSEMVSITALIPAFFGVAFVILARLAGNEKLRKHVMHVSAALSLVAVIGTFSGILAAYSLIVGGDVARPGAAISKAVMAVLSLAYLILCVKSFVAARRTRVAANTN